MVDELPDPEDDEHAAREQAEGKQDLIPAADPAQRHQAPLRELSSSYAIPVATAYTVW